MAQKKEIQFNKSMNIDKRNELFAYLRKGVADIGTPGLYPAVDFEQVTTSLLDDDGILGISGSESGGPTNPGPFIIVQRGSNIIFFEMDGTQTGHSPVPIEDFLINAIANGNDGVYIANATKVQRPGYNTNTVSLVGTFPELPSVEIGCFDGLHYWWLGGQIWRQLSGEDPELIMAETPFTGDILFAVPYQDYIVIFVRDETDTGSGNHESSVVYFFDKKNATFFYKRINMKHRTLLAAANINETLTLVYSESTLGNPQEQRGRLVVSQWSGERFVEVNSIKTGRYNLTPYINYKGFNCDFNSSYLIFAVNGNTATTGDEDLYKNYIYKVDSEGNIEVLTESTIESPDFISGLYLGNQFISYYLRSIESTPPLLFTQQMSYEASPSVYTNFNDTKYITNFYCNPYNRHKLNAVNISFEKLFTGSTLETLDIYYRTSDREDWILLATITINDVIDNVNKRIDMSADVPIPQQRYQILKMPDGGALPEFNEIQFSFLSKNGFSIIGAWFEYEYLTRDSVK